MPLSAIVIGSVGYSLIEGGLTLAWKRVELIHELATGIMIFFSGALIPLDRLPAWMAEIGRLTPVSQAVIALRAVLIDGRSDLRVDGDGGLFLLAVTSGACLLAGVAVFSLGERLARRHGSLGRY